MSCSPWGHKEWDLAEQLNSNTTERRSNLSILKKSTLNVIGRTDAEAPILWPPDTRDDSLEKTLMLGKIEGRKRRGRQRTRWLDGITNSMAMGLGRAE